MREKMEKVADDILKEGYGTGAYKLRTDIKDLVDNYLNSNPNSLEAYRNAVESLKKVYDDYKEQLDMLEWEL